MGGAMHARHGRKVVSFQSVAAESERYGFVQNIERRYRLARTRKRVRHQRDEVRLGYLCPDSRIAAPSLLHPDCARLDLTVSHPCPSF